jgi:hypothetical protein
MTPRRRAKECSLKGLLGGTRVMSNYEVIPDAKMIRLARSLHLWLAGRDMEKTFVPGRCRLQPPPGLRSPDGFAEASRKVEDAIQKEWKAHIAPSEAILGVAAAAREYAQARPGPGRFLS